MTQFLRSSLHLATTTTIKIVSTCIERYYLYRGPLSCYLPLTSRPLFLSIPVCSTVYPLLWTGALDIGRRVLRTNLRTRRPPSKYKDRAFALTHRHTLTHIIVSSARVVDWKYIRGWVLRSGEFYEGHRTGTYTVTRVGGSFSVLPRSYRVPSTESHTPIPCYSLRSRPSCSGAREVPSPDRLRSDRQRTVSVRRDRDRGWKGPGLVLRNECQKG